MVFLFTTKDFSLRDILFQRVLQSELGVHGTELIQTPDSVDTQSEEKTSAVHFRSSDVSVAVSDLCACQFLAVMLLCHFVFLV